MIHADDVTEKNKSNLEIYCKEKLTDPYSSSSAQDVIPVPQVIDNDNLKVIHGTMEIANQMHTMVQGLRKLGVDAKTINYYPAYLKYKSDVLLNINAYKSQGKAHALTKELASEIIPQYDVFHFHFGTSLTLNYSDLPLLRELNKKVLMHHWGSDVRMYSQAVKRNPYVKVKVWDEGLIRRNLNLFSTLIDTCAVCDSEIYEYVKNYYSRVVVIPQLIDIDEFDLSGEITPNEKLTIVHAPTSPEIKGTCYILQAVEELKEKYDFNFILVKGMAYTDAKKVYQTADIVIDQLLIGSYGLVSIESMAMGKPVICWISDFMKEQYPKELPIISANPDNIRQVLEGLLNSRDSLTETGKRSRHYVETYHDINKYSQTLLDIYKSL